LSEFFRHAVGEALTSTVLFGPSFWPEIRAWSRLFRWLPTVTGHHQVTGSC
jgi:hypothetical protein